MKNAITLSILACALCAVPATALANPHDQGDHQQSTRASAASNRQQSPTYRQAPTSNRRQTTTYRQAPANDRQQSPSYHQSQSTDRYQPRPVQPMPRYQARQDVNVYAYNSGRDVRPWQWNHGAAWYARPNYWGGGFWGAIAIGLSFNESPGYYVVQPSSPGAQLLAQYNLTQTTCDQPNLVDIYGPDGSEICAYPNDMVSPGAYNVDYATLTLTSN